LLGYPGVDYKKTRIVRIEKEYDRVFTYYLERPSGFTFESGQYFHLVAPRGYINNHDVRHISLANAPDEDVLMVTMDLASETRFKRRFEGARVGDGLGFYSVKGVPVLEGVDADTSLVLIAGGVGITPFRSMIQAGVQHPWHLIYAGRGYCYQSLWEGYGSKQVTFVTRATLWESLDKQIDVCQFFIVCGSSGFVHAVAEYLASKSVPSDKVRLEDFQFDETDDSLLLTDSKHG
ncbi:MAG: hypothetical protein AAGH40_07445, partial [Verrucomicrobiota bacterium]